MSSFLENVQVEVKQEDLKSLTDLCKKLLEKRKEIDFAKQSLEKLEDQEKMLSQQLIPNMFLQVGLSEIKLETGEKVTIKEDISVSLPKKDQVKRSKVLAWIVANNGEGIIKRIVTIVEPTGDILAFLKENQIPYSDFKDIHSRTLWAWFREMLGLKKGSIQRITPDEAPKEAGLFMYKKTDIK